MMAALPPRCTSDGQMKRSTKWERSAWRRRLLVLLALVTAIACVLVVVQRIGSLRQQAARPRAPVFHSGWTTKGADILTPAGKQFIIAGISWYGFETPQRVLWGLDTQNYTDILNQAKTYQYNTLRIPISSEMWETNPIPNYQLVHA